MCNSVAVFWYFISPSGLFISKVLRDFSKSTITTAQSKLAIVMDTIKVHGRYVLMMIVILNPESQNSYVIG